MSLETRELSTSMATFNFTTEPAVQWSIACDVDNALYGSHRGDLRDLHLAQLP